MGSVYVYRGVPDANFSSPVLVKNQNTQLGCGSTHQESDRSSKLCALRAWSGIAGFEAGFDTAGSRMARSHPKKRGEDDEGSAALPLSALLQNASELVLASIICGVYTDDSSEALLGKEVTIPV